MNCHRNGPGWKEEFLKRRRQAEIHLEFAAKLCMLQHTAGRLVVFEHPLGATSWSTKAMTKLKEETRAYTSVGQQCQFGLTTEVDGEKAPVKKPTQFLTSSWFIASALNRQCKQQHKHFSLMEGRAARAAVYPEPLARAFCQGLLDQKEYDRTGMVPTRVLSIRELSAVVRSASSQHYPGKAP